MKICINNKDEPEIFLSLQGEGIYCGQRSVFIRLHGCNLDCEWCDTKYSSTGKYKDMLVEDIFMKVSEFNCKYIVITGGEPMLQQSELIVLCTMLLENGYLVTIETNGTIRPDDKFFITSYLSNLLFSVSPKLSNSGNMVDDLSFNVSYFILCYYTQLKFVITKDMVRDITEVCNFVKLLKLHEHTPIILQLNSQVYISPGTILGREMYLSDMIHLFDYIKKDVLLSKYNIHVLPQLHFLLWGNERGK